MEELKCRLLRFKEIRQAVHKLVGAPSEIIVSSACKVFEQPRHLVLSRTRTEEVVRVRHAIFFVAHNRHTGYSEIARIMSNGRGAPMDHGTVMHGVKRCQERMDTDKDYAAKVRALESACEGTL